MDSRKLYRQARESRAPIEDKYEGYSIDNVFTRADLAPRPGNDQKEKILLVSGN